jgi:FKBP-type peptidyl-prolyl cis-trans isomerase
MHWSAVALATTVVLSGNGLVIKDLKKGHGVGAQNGDTITVNYVGKLTNGKTFDSSKTPGRTPFTLILGQHQVIPGWEKGLLGMKVGGTRKLTIPPDMAYGAAGRPPVIPENATLIFTVDMVKIVHPGK